MRVISGSARGKKLLSQEGLNTRPTLDRVKEALFNIIQFKVADARVLDLFAGSGALGIEALSRGAKEAVFCDNNKDAFQIITKNVKNTKVENKSIILKKDYDLALEKLYKGKNKFDIIFLDPPYKTDFALKSIKKITDYKLLTEEGIIILETNDVKKIEEVIQLQEIEIFDQRKYGKVILVFIRKE